MKIKFMMFVAGLLLAASMMTSCLDTDDTEYTYSSNASITAFSIDDIETEYTTQIDGVDTTLTATVTGDDYTFVIDQVQHLIYNVDSLPCGTDITKVVAEITFDSSYLLITDQEASESKDTLWTSGDSLDFTKPIIMKVYAYDGSYGEPYTVKLNVHQVVPDSLVWRDLSAGNNFQGNTAQKGQKAVCFKQRIYVLEEGDTQVKITSTATSDGRSWTALTELPIAEKADYQSAMVWGDALYLLAGNQLYRSEDAETWTAVDGASGLTTLVANLDTDRHHRLVAVDTDGYLTESTDGSTWTPTETLPDGFPVSGLSYVGYDLASNPAIGRMVVLGENQADADTMHVVWSKLTTESTWGNLLLTVNDASCLPRLKQVAMISYDHKLYAFGGASQNGSTEVGAFGSFYVSEDGAVSWTAVTASLFFPEEFPDLYDEAGGTFAYVVDENDYLWILWGGQTGVWRSRVNRLGFDK
jgi:hypothetical protein